MFPLSWRSSEKIKEKRKKKQPPSPQSVSIRSAYSSPQAKPTEIQKEEIRNRLLAIKAAKREKMKQVQHKQKEAEKQHKEVRIKTKLWKERILALFEGSNEVLGGAYGQRKSQANRADNSGSNSINSESSNESGAIHGIETDRAQEKEKMLRSRGVRDLCYMGIPSSVRGKVWPLLIGERIRVSREVYSSFNKYSDELYRKALQRDEDFEGHHRDRIRAEGESESVSLSLTGGLGLESGSGSGETASEAGVEADTDEDGIKIGGGKRVEEKEDFTVKACVPSCREYSAVDQHIEIAHSSDCTSSEKVLRMSSDEKKERFRMLGEQLIIQSSTKSMLSAKSETETEIEKTSSKSPSSESFSQIRISSACYVNVVGTESPKACSVNISAMGSPSSVRSASVSGMESPPACSVSGIIAALRERESQPHSNRDGDGELLDENGNEDEDKMMRGEMIEEDDVDEYDEYNENDETEEVGYEVIDPSHFSGQEKPGIDPVDKQRQKLYRANDSHIRSNIDARLSMKDDDDNDENEEREVGDEMMERQIGRDIDAEASMRNDQEEGVVDDGTETFVSSRESIIGKFSASGTDRDSSSRRELFSKLLLIDRDLPRTFSTLAFFHDGGPLNQALERVLRSYCCYRPDVGYIQGMSFVVAMLLLNMDEYEAFVCLVNLLEKRGNLDFYRVDPAAVASFVICFDKFFKKFAPNLFQHFRSEGVSSEMFLLDWNITIFSKALPVDIAMRLWDVYLLEGELFVVRTGIALLRLSSSQLMGKSVDEILPVLAHLPASLTVEAVLGQVIEVMIRPETFERAKINAAIRVASLQDGAFMTTGSHSNASISRWAIPSFQYPTTSSSFSSTIAASSFSSFSSFSSIPLASNNNSNSSGVEHAPMIASESLTAAQAASASKSSSTGKYERRDSQKEKLGENCSIQ